MKKLQKYILYSSSELETRRLACSLAAFIQVPCNIYLYGEVGSGKTSFCRGFLRGLGYLGRVNSPSYIVVESYVLTSWIVYHFDFYRFSTYKELEYIGVRDYFDCHSLRLVEWPDLMRDILPTEDIAVYLEYYRSYLRRRIILTSFTCLGQLVLNKLFDSKSIMYDEAEI